MNLHKLGKEFCQRGGKEIILKKIKILHFFVNHRLSAASLLWRTIFKKGCSMYIEEIVVEVIEAIPRGQVFDENDVIGRLLKDYRYDYLVFLAGHAQTRNPMDAAAAAIAGEIEKFEGVFVERQGVGAVSNRLRSVTYECTQWKRI
jgi:hypothetical protein